MSKSYLIVDTPEACGACPLIDHEYNDGCRGTDALIETCEEECGYNYLVTRPPICPLNPLGKLIDADVLVEWINDSIPPIPLDRNLEKGLNVMRDIILNHINELAAESEGEDVN